MLNKNEVFVEEFSRYLEDDDLDSIKNNLPKFLKYFKKISARTDKILKQSDSQQLEVLKLTEKLHSTNEKTNTLLNNAGQGFLYFDQDMLVGAEYSREVYNIFNQDIKDKNIATLLYPNDTQKAKFLEMTLKSILNDEPMRQEILISLLETEFEFNNKFIEIEYKVINDHNFMLILTDITSKKELDQKIKDEQQILKMVVEVVITKEQFLEVKKDYEDFIQHLDKFKTLDNLSELRKEIHTYKGLFAQKEMLHIVKSLHNFETIIDTCIKNKSLTQQLLNTTKDDMINWLYKDINVIESVLGDNFFKNANYIDISKYRIQKLYKKALDYKNSKDITVLDDVLKDIQNLQYNNIKIFFRPYEKLVEQLSQQLEKLVNPLVLDIENIYLPDIYIPFINSLVHIFRNSVDHGLEEYEERLETQKDEYGTIKCSVKQQNKSLIVTISDDGRGVDTDKIKQIALDKGLYTQDEIQSLSQEEVILIIFKDSFTTRDKITQISGRGVGLASIIDELDRLNGTIEIKNNLGFGIEFKFTLPFGDNDE